MSRFFDAYRAVHQQAFLPIFVDDDLDSKMLVEACVEAGMTAIEYTLRRRDAHIMVPWIRENYPDLYLLVGSTVDDDRIVAKQKRHHPQLLTVAELDAMGVDGFISMLGWHEESLRKYSHSRIIMPTAMTVNEALFQVGAGAHFVKMLGSNLDFVKRCRAKPTFGYCPILVTGGVTAERMDPVMEAGAALTATGFDLTLADLPGKVTRKQVAGVMKRYMRAACAARRKHWPEIAKADKSDNRSWVDALTHYHPF